jgi:hypothetical protein
MFVPSRQTMTTYVPILCKTDELDLLGISERGLFERRLF